MTIPEGGEKLKGLSRELAIPTIVVLVGLTSFGLGRFSAEGMGRGGLKIYYPPNYQSMLGASAAQGGSTVAPDSAGVVVASKLGSKYFYPDCSGAKSISEANKITFASTAEARKAGYTPAANCKGLQ